MHSQLKH